VAEAKRITNFEGKRRQMQYIGKLMRGQDEETRQAVRDALEEQRKGSASDALALHQAEQWRDDLVGNEAALEKWLSAYPRTDTQQLRALIRQARKDVHPDQDAVSKGLAPRQGRAYREIFQLVRGQLTGTDIPASESDADDPRSARQDLS
jgi:ribosome-associated protein